MSRATQGSSLKKFVGENSQKYFLFILLIKRIPGNPYFTGFYYNKLTNYYYSNDNNILTYFEVRLRH